MQTYKYLYDLYVYMYVFLYVQNTSKYTAYLISPLSPYVRYVFVYRYSMVLYMSRCHKKRIEASLKIRQRIWSYLVVSK